MSIEYLPLTADRCNSQMKELHGSASYATLDSIHDIEVNQVLDKYVATAHVRASYRLNYPVINYSIAGNNASNLCPILGLKAAVGEKLCGFDYCYYGSKDHDDRTFVSINSIKLNPHEYFSDSSKQILFGPMYFKFAIKHLDLRARIEDVLAEDAYAHLRELLKNAKETSSDGTTIPVISDFYFKTDKVLNPDEIKLATSIIQDNLYDMMKKGNSTLAQLLSLYEMSDEKRVDVLNSCFHDFIVIVPKNLRPEMTTGGRDPLDKMYMNVMRANTAFLGTEEVTENNYLLFLDKYRKLDSATNELISSSKPPKPNYRSMIQRLSSKNGHIRAINLGKRQDFSGRSVIVVNPKMPIQFVGIPKKTIPKLFQYHILEALKRNEAPNPHNIDAKIVTAPTHNKTTINHIVEYAVNAGILGSGPNSVPVTIGRQPTLHKGSMSSFWVVPVDGSAIELSPLIVPPFNADFDGDTMYDSVPISKGAIEEASTLLMHRNNLFWAKDGELGIVPRQEILYGLNQCTKDNYPNYSKDTKNIMGDSFRAPTRFRMSANITPAIAYDRIIHNKMRVYDEVEYASGHTITAGRLAFKHAIGVSQMAQEFDHSRKITYICPKCGEVKEDVTTISCTCSKCDIEMVPTFTIKGCQCPYCKKVTTAIDAVNDPNVKVLYSGFSHNELVNDVTAYNNQVDADKALIAEKTKTMRDYITGTKLLSKILSRDGYYEALVGVIRAILSGIDYDYTETEITTEMLEETKQAYARSNLINKFLNSIKFSSKYEELLADIATEKKVCRVHYDAKTNYYVVDGPAYKIYGELVEAHHEFYKAITGIKPNTRLDKYIDNNCIESCHYCQGSITGVEVTKNNISMFTNRLLVSGVDKFLAAVDKLVELGFAVAKNYAPTLNVLDTIEFDDEMEVFHKSIETHKYMHSIGLLEDDQYDIMYTEAYGKLKKSIYDADKDKKTGGKLGVKLTTNNGFLKMVQSGARGSMDNLVQMYGTIGQVTKNSQESFNAIIEDCYIKQLKPTAHFITAYGARRGIMNRALETAKTGYMSRQLWHATQSAVITNKDCGTTDGITIERSDFAILGLDTNFGSTDSATIEKYFSGMLVGRYIPGEDRPISMARARDLAKGEAVTIRSPLTCKNPCCAKCYGMDPSIHDEVVVGTPVGIIAAEAIGETTSQLTMRTFQGGSTAKKGGIGSAFNEATNVVHMADIAKKCPDTYEPIAWEDGVVTSHIDKNGNRVLQINDNKACRVTVNADMPIKSEVKRGEGMFTKVGDRDPRDYIKYAGITSAQKYVVFKLFALFRDSALINLKHFEILAMCMSKAVVISKPKNSKLKLGGLYSSRELYESHEDLSKHVLKWTMVSIRSAASVSASPTASFSFEEVKAQLFNMMVFEKVDNFSGPIESIMYAKTPKIGKKINPNFIQERTNFHVSGDIVD